MMTPGKPVVVTNHPLSEEPSPNVQSEFPLAHSMTSCPIVGYHQSYTDEHRCPSHRLMFSKSQLYLFLP